MARRGWHNPPTLRALPKIDRREMKAEHIDRPAQRRQPRRDQDCAMICRKRGFDDAEVGLQRLRVAIGFAVRDRVARGLGAGEIEQGRREPCIDAYQGAAIRLVVTLRVFVAGAIRQSLQVGRGSASER